MLTEPLGFLLPAIGLFSNVDRIVEIAEGVGMVAAIVGAPKIAGVSKKVENAVSEIVETQEVSVGLKVVEALEDGKLQPAEIGELAMEALQLEKRIPAKKSLRELRQSRLDR